MSNPSNQSDLMRTDLQRSLKGSPIDPSRLTSFQRILLTTDGMVTEMLEANYWERMVVELLFQEDYALEKELTDLECKRGEHVLDRRILLRGRMSHLARIYAESFIVRDRLSDFIRDGLLNSSKPIGLLILESRLETFREILGCVREEAGDIAVHFQIEPSDRLISRRYRVIADGQPIMLITEKFPEREID
jgi:chorismate-pyruvate lyase